MHINVFFQRFVAVLSLLSCFLLGFTGCNMYQSSGTPVYSQHDACKQQSKPTGKQGAFTERAGMNWSGYNTDSANPPAPYPDGDWSVCASWQVGSDTCTNGKASDGRWVGLQPGNDSDQHSYDRLVQVVTMFDCTLSPPHWQYCWEILPDAAHCYDDPALIPGTWVTGWVTYHNDNGRANYEFSIFGHTFHQPDLDPPTFADIILEAVTRQKQTDQKEKYVVMVNATEISWLAAFPQAKFRNCLVNGMPFFSAPSLKHNRQYYLNSKQQQVWNTSESIATLSSFTINFLSA